MFATNKYKCNSRGNAWRFGASIRFSNYILDDIAAVLNGRENIAGAIEIKHRKIFKTECRKSYYV